MMLTSSITNKNIIKQWIIKKYLFINKLASLFILKKERYIIIPITNCLNIIKLDFEEALKYVKMAAENGNDDAMKKYAKMITNEKKTLSKKNAVDKLRTAADNGHTTAMHFLEVLLAQNNEEPYNLEESARYLRLAADAGNVVAMYSIGLAFLRRRGVDINN